MIEGVAVTRRPCPPRASDTYTVRHAHESAL